MPRIHDGINGTYPWIYAVYMRGIEMHIEPHHDNDGTIYAVYLRDVKNNVLRTPEGNKGAPALFYAV